MINKKLINFKTKAQFTAKLSQIDRTSIVFIEDTKEIWTHGVFYGLSDGNDHNHDLRYLKLIGGTLTGDLTAPKFISSISGKSVEMLANAAYGKIQTRGSIPLLINDEGNNVAIGKTTAIEKLDINGNVLATGYKKSGSSDSYVLLGGGGHKTVTSLETPYEANLQWGGKNFSSSYGCLDAAMVDSLGANRLAFAKPAGISVEYSRDSGATWIDYGATDAQKLGLTSCGTGLNIGKCDSTNKDDGTYQLRITFGTPSTCGIYNQFHKFCMLVSTNGSTGVRCKIEASLMKSPNTFVTFSDAPIGGWSGYNIINTNTITFGNGDTQYGYMRFTFSSTGGSTQYNGLQVMTLYGFGGVGWTTPSNMAKNGHLYSYDGNQHALFPANLKSGGWLYEGNNRVYSGGNTNIGTGSTNYAAGNQPITAISTTATAATFTRGAGNLTLPYPTFNQDTTGNAGTVTNGVYLTATQTLTNKTLTTPIIHTIVNQGYQHRLEIGRAGYDRFDFYEYGGIYNFYKCTDATGATKTLLGKITVNGWEGNVVGNATSSTKLQTSRTLWGKPFDGTVAITGDLIDVGNINSTNSSFILKTSGANIGFETSAGQTKAVTLNASSFKPYDTANNQLDLGSTAAKWKNVYATNFTGNLTGTADNAIKFNNRNEWDFIRNNQTSSTSSTNVDADSLDSNSIKHDYRWDNANASSISSILDVSYSPDWRTQLQFHHKSSPEVYIRSRYSGTTWSSWGKLWNSFNFTPSSKADLASPVFTGTPSAPTAAAKTNTTQIATTAFVRKEVADLVNGAPESLDTLKEIADYLTNGSIAGSIVDQLSKKVNKIGDTLTGRLVFNNCDGIAVASNNTDLSLLKVWSSDQGEGKFGFDIKYIGTGGANDNILRIISDNQTGTKINALDIKQDGTIIAGASINAIGGLKVNNSNVWHAGNSNLSSINWSTNKLLTKVLQLRHPNEESDRGIISYVAGTEGICIDATQLPDGYKYITLKGASNGIKLLNSVSITGNVSASNLWNTIVIEKTLQVTSEWMDTGIIFDAATISSGTGSYMISVTEPNYVAGAGGYFNTHTGNCTIYVATTNHANNSDEILLHKGGHAGSDVIYLRTVTQASSGYTKLQIASSKGWTASNKLVFKFRRVM